MTWLGVCSVGLLVLCYGWPLWKRVLPAVLPAVLVGVFLYDVLAHEGGRWTFEALGALIAIGFVGGAVFFILVLPVTWALVSLVSLFAPRKRKTYPLVSHGEIEELRREYPGLSYDQTGEILSKTRLEDQSAEQPPVSPPPVSDPDPLSPENVERLLDDTLAGMTSDTGEAPGR
jgi:hypothetical protein